MPNGSQNINMNVLQDQIVSWGAKTFPRSTLRSIWLHMQEELYEVEEAIATGDVESILEEIADINILAIQIAGKLDRSLIDRVVEKFAEIQENDWEEIPEGYSKRVK